MYVPEIKMGSFENMSQMFLFLKLSHLLSHRVKKYHSWRETISLKIKNPKILKQFTFIYNLGCGNSQNK